MMAEQTTGGPRRVKRPKDKEELIQRLVGGPDGPFSEIRDALTFAAALGFKEGRRKPFTGSGGEIRWETFKNRRGTEQLVGMLAVAEKDRDVVADNRFADQIEVFEEYANGGLEVLEETLGRSPHRRPRDVVLELVQNELIAAGDAEDPLDLGGDLELI